MHLGTPGVAELTKLMTISARIGIADSARYLKKNKPHGRSTPARPASSGPTRCSRGWRRPSPTRAPMSRALHLFTFNQVEATVEWQERMLAEL